MKTSLDVLLTPAEFARLRGRDLSQSACVVFDILRATSTMITALANGAAAILPVAEISDALSIRKEHPEVLLAGEREGLRILSSSAGGVDFDLGNSPREFTPERVQDKTIVMTTTNGTRALQACAHANTVLVGSFLNLSSVAQWIQTRVPQFWCWFVRAPLMNVPLRTPWRRARCATSSGRFMGMAKLPIPRASHGKSTEPCRTIY